jgi:hypothetical protein
MKDSKKKQLSFIRLSSELFCKNTKCIKSDKLYAVTLLVINQR